MTAGLVAAVDLGASSGRVMVGRVAPGRARADRGPSLPERAGPAARRPPLGHPAALPRGAGRAARGGPAPTAWSASGSTRGASTTACVDDGRQPARRPVPLPRRAERRRRSTRSTRSSRRPSCMPGPGSSSCRSTRSTSSRRRAGRRPWRRPRSMLLIPDLIGYWLSGTRVSEVTNASTTGAARRPPADVGHRADRCDRAAGPDLPVARRTRRRRRSAARRGPRRDRLSRRDRS